MKTNKIVGIIVLTTLALGAGNFANAAGKDKPDAGKSEFQNRCAVCHGPGGKGDGGAIDILKAAPADLTVLSKKNGGVFPFDRVYSVIDGRQIVKGHGTRDMPIWGKVYSTETVKADEYYAGMPYDMEMYVHSRILALIDYLNRLQVK